MRRVLLTAGVAAVSLLAAGCASSATGASNSGSSPVVLRLGFLANITHEPALVGIAKGFFTKDLGNNVTLKTTINGASATFGKVWLSINQGIRARSRVRELRARSSNVWPFRESTSGA